MTEAILLVAHGDREGEAQKVLSQIGSQLRKRFPERNIYEAVLLAHPEHLHVVNVLERLIAEGVNDLVIFPWFLFAGPHVRKDLPGLIADVQSRHPHFQCSLLEPLGADPILIDLLGQRLGLC
jgi:sirohydrochlorin cobaltochelatase